MNRADKAAAPKKRHTGLVVFLCILLLLLAVLGGVAWRYRAGLAILIDNFGKSSEQVSVERENHERKTQELLDKLSGGGISLSALSEADRLRLKNGEITPAEAVAIIMGLAETTASAAASTDAPPVSDVTVGPAVPDAPATSAASAATEPTAAATTAPAGTTAPAATTVSPAVQAIIADIYLLRAEFINKLDDLIEEGKAEVNAIPKEKRTASVKLEFMNRYLDRGEALEAECDARLEALLADMAAQLKADGGDLSLVDDARALYVQEKKVRKAELYRKYVGS